jgi:Kef-type K+ transport system membrane component KefB
VPRVLQRARIPSAVTCVALGAVLGMGFGLFSHDTALPLLATLGIVALFLFAGLEVDLEELRHGLAVTVGHLALQLLLLAVSTPLLASLFSLELRPSLLLALALLTPSTGFILDSLPAFGLTPRQQFWVKTKAIASEIVALVALFLVVQSSSVFALGTSLLALGAMILVLPHVFQIFAARVLPFAPKSEFTFLLILALICAYLTRHLGVYYLVGAFVVGVTAVRMRKRLPDLASPRLLIGIELFASFFVPFYFFKAGLHLETRYFTWRAILLGLAFVVLAVPLRVGLGALVRRVLLGESVREGLRVGLSLTPTLVFTLVLADILRERFALGDALYGALVVFALLTTVLPGFFLRSMPEFSAPEVPKPLSMAPTPGPDMASARPAPEAPDLPDKPSVAEGL